MSAKDEEDIIAVTDCVEDAARDQEDAAKKEVKVSSSGRGTDTIREVTLPTPGICFPIEILIIIFFLNRWIDLQWAWMDCCWDQR